MNQSNIVTDQITYRYLIKNIIVAITKYIRMVTKFRAIFCIAKFRNHPNCSRIESVSEMGKNIAGASVIRKDLFLTNFEYDSNPNFVILVKKNTWNLPMLLGDRKTMQFRPRHTGYN
jgi:hypothetical protein